MKQRVKLLNAEIARLQSEAKALYEDIAKKSADGTKSYDGHSDDLAKFYKMVEDGQAKQQELKALNDLLSLEEGQKPAERPSPGPMEGERREKSLGEIVTSAPSFPEWQKNRSITAFEVETKDHSEGVPAEGGRLVWSDRRLDPLMGNLRPLSVIDVIPVMPTSSNAIDYVVEDIDNYVEGADIVPEKAVKPETNIRFISKSANVDTIAHYVVVTEQLMEDAPRFRAIIDLRLGDGIMRKLEEKIIGSTSGHIIGILSSAGLARVHQVASNALGGNTDNYFDTIRYGITDMLLKFYRPDTVILNPVLSAKFDTAKDTQGRYLASFDPIIKRLWNLRTVEAAGTLMPAGTAVVMDSQQSCTLFDRRTRRIDVGWFNDLFIKNQFAIRGEGRFAFTTEYPLGLNKITGLV